MNHKACAIVLSAVLFCSCAPKQQIKQPELVLPSPPAEELRLPVVEAKREPAPEPKKAETRAMPEKKAEEQYVMLNFENADIETVISTICEMLKINYIIAPGVTGKITIQSNNKIPMSELFTTFQTVLEFNGFTAVKHGSFYRIVAIDTAKQQPLRIESGKEAVVSRDQSFVTQEIPLAYVKASDVANMLRNLMPRGTDFVVFEPSNLLIVTAPPTGIVKFLKLLEAIDIPASDRDAVKTFVYNVENGEAKKLVEILKNIYVSRRPGEGAAKTVQPSAGAVAPAATAPAARTPQRPVRLPQAGATVEGLAGEIEGEVVIEAYEDINALLIKATPRGYLSLLETIKKLDIQPKQVLIEVLIAEITLDSTTQFGIEWLLKTTSNGKDIIGGFTKDNKDNIIYDTSKNLFVPASANNVLVHPANAFASIIDPQRFNILLTASATNGKLNVIASPHILALDNKEAKIEIADEVPVATAITSPIAGAGSIVNTTSQVQFKSAGTILTVTPHINEKKQVTLKITQEVSDIGKTFPIGGQDFQGFTTRKATTSAIVQDGHTLVLGGIINETKHLTRSSIPLLGDIPILGYLFGSTTDTNTRKELILLVTPHVIASHDEADDVTREMKSRMKGLQDRIEKGVREKAAVPGQAVEAGR